MQLLPPTIVFALAIVTSAKVLNNQDWRIGQEVQTSSGRVKGHAAKRPGFSEVSEYLGIRYAEPQIGELRFAAPKAFRSNDTFNAEKFVSSSCT